MKRLTQTAILLTILGLILSGCGGAGQPSNSISLTMTEFSFLPNTLTVPAGEEIKISVTNSGAVAHDLMIMKLGYELRNHAPGDDLAADAYWKQEQLEAGAVVQSTFIAPAEPGEYLIVCGVAGHLEAGMVGKLVVVASP